MTDEIKKDTVDYNDQTPFDGSKLQPISEISKAIRHKTYGVDTREAIAQQGEALVKLMQDSGSNPNGEVQAARGNFDLLGIREDAQDNAIVKAQSTAVKAQSTANSKFDSNQAESYFKSITVVPETFANLAAIKSKYPSGKTGLMVAADNGHKYIWTNNTWTDAGVYQAVGIADGTVTPEKTTFIESNNVFDSSNSLSGGFWKREDGSWQVREGVKQSEKYPLPADSYIYFNRLSTEYGKAVVQFWDDNDVYLGCKIDRDYVVDWKTLYPKAKRFSFAYYALEESELRVYTRPLFSQLKDVDLKQSFEQTDTEGIIKAGDISASIRNDLFEYQKVDYTLLKDTHYRQEGLFAVVYHHPDYHSGVVNVSKGEVYRVSTVLGKSINQSGIIIVDSENKIIYRDLIPGQVEKESSHTVELVMPPNANKLIASVYLDNPLTIEKQQPKTYVVDQWQGKKVLYQGDSITDPNYNAGLSTRWTDVVTEQLGLIDIGNYAISGSTLAVNPDRPTERHPIVKRLESMGKGADVVFNAAITNDFMYSWSPIGNMSSRDETTLYGALHLICMYYKKNYPDAVIIFLTAIKRNQDFSDSPTAVNDFGKTLDEYNDILKEVCRYYSIRVLDMNIESGLFPFDNELALRDYNDQGYFTHPNGSGQLKMGKAATGYLHSIYP